MGRIGQAGLVFLIALAVLVPRLWPVLAPAGNHGELAAAGACLGVAHPPGYPVVVQGIRLIQLLPLGSLGWRANLLSALMAATLGAVLFGWLRPLAGPGPAALAAAGLLLGRGMLEEALAVEVYGANLLALLLVIRLLDGPANPRRWAAAALVAGLGLAGHPILLFGLVGAMALLPLGRLRPGPRALLLLIPLGLGLSAFLALPIRSAAGVPVDWGQPDRWGMLLAHTTGRQFHGQMFSSSPAEALWRLRDLLRHLGSNLPTPVLILGALGLVLHPPVFRRRLAALGLGALLLLGYAANYGIPDISVYLLPVELLVALAWVGPVSRLASSPGARRTAGLALCALALVLAARLPDHSSDHLARDYGCRLLERVPPGGLLVSQGDLTTGGLTYLTVAEGLRPDVTLHDRLGNLIHQYQRPREGPFTDRRLQERALIERFRGKALYADLPLRFPRQVFRCDGLAYRPHPPGQTGPIPIPVPDRRPIRGLGEAPGDSISRRLVVLRTHLGRMIQAREAGDLSRARIELDRARTQAQGAHSLQYLLGRTLLQEGWHEPAIPALSAAAEALPFDAALWNSLAWSRLRSGGDLTQALDEIDRAVELDRSRGAYRHSRGMILLALDRPFEAVAALAEALRLEPDSQAYARDLARARQAAGLES